MSGNPSDAVIDLAGLRSGSFSGVGLGVVGFPIRHSLSPAMHRAALARLAKADPRFEKWSYTAFEIEPSDLPEAVDLFREKGFRGINLTVPHKVEVLPLLDEIDPATERMGAVNTLFFDREVLRGFNTDGYGLEQALLESFGVGLKRQHVLLVGAGGAGRAAAAQCVDSGVASLLIANRTVEKARQLAEKVSQGEVVAKGIAVAEVPSHVMPGVVVINATSLGLKGGDPLPLEVSDLPEQCLLFDMIYNPAETPFLLAGRARGYPVANGLGMLVHQGARSLEIWSGREVDVSAMREALTRNGISS